MIVPPRAGWLRSRALLILLCGAFAWPASAQDAARFPELVSPAGRRLIWAIDAVRPGAIPDPDSVFVPAFFERIPRSAILEGVREVSEESGGLTLRSVWQSAPHELTAAACAAADGAWWRIVVNVEQGAPYRLTRLSYNHAPEFGPPELSDWSELDSLLAPIGETVSFASYSVEPDGLRPIFLRQADRPVAIASAFKLWVLGALAELVQEGGAHWTDELAIRDEWKTLPSGRMQNLPEGETRTLAEYALQMISISDNTAADHLIHRIGRERVVDYAERHGAALGKNRPFLTVGELFKLKISADSTLLERYVTGTVDTRHRILADRVASLPTPNAADEPDVPTAIETVEWFAPASGLGRLIAHLATVGRGPGQEPVWDALTRNPGFHWNRNTWPVIAYKGGLEAGVVNLTWLLERGDGRRFVMVLGVNDTQAVPDRTEIVVAAAAAGRLLEKEP